MATFVWAAAVAGNWSVGANWQVGGVPQAAPPTATDDVQLGAGTGFTQSNCTMAAGDTCQSLDCTGYTGTLTLPAATTITIVRWYKFVAGMTLTLGAAATSALKLTATTDNGGAGWPITNGGKQIGPITFDGVGGKWTAQDAFTVGPAAGATNVITLTLTNGNLDLASLTHNINTLAANNTNTKTFSATGTINFTNNGAGNTMVGFSAATAADTTLNVSTASFVLTLATANNRSFELGTGLTWGSFVYTVAASTGQILFRRTTTGNTGTASTITALHVAGGRTLRMRAGVTFPIASAAGFDVGGTAGNLVTIDTNTAGTAATISIPSGNIDAQYLSIKDSTATGGASFWAENSTNVSGNTGWTFGARRTLTDAFGLTGTQTFAQTAVRTITDAEGLSDSRTSITASARAITDSFGLTDPRTSIAAYARAITDPLGLTDGMIAAAAYQRAQTDPLGLTDAASSVTAAVRAITDALGLTDALASVSAAVRSLTDPMGLTDTLSPVTASARALTDAFGLADSTIAAAALTRAVTDAFGLTDSSATVVAYQRSLTDPLGLTDPMTFVWTQVIDRVITDGFGLTDDVVGGLIVVVVLTDHFGLGDLMTWLHHIAPRRCDPPPVTGSRLVAVGAASSRLAAAPTIGPNGNRRNQ